MIRSKKKNQSFCVFFELNCCVQKPERGCETHMHGPKTHTFRYLHQKPKVLEKILLVLRRREQTEEEPDYKSVVTPKLLSLSD